MPQLQFDSVDHDPFAALAQFVPVDHDPFASSHSIEAVDHDPFALPGEPQRQSRGEILSQGLDKLKDFLTPGYLRDTPSSPQADRALADPNGKPGKIGPPSGPPTAAQIAGGLASDIGLNALPLGKLLAAMPPAIAGNPALVARFHELVAKGYGRQAIADDLAELSGRPIGKATVGRFLKQTGQTTAAAENFKPGVLGDRGNDEVIKAGLARGDSHATIAGTIGTSPGNVSQRINRLRASGELPDYQSRGPSFWENPAKQAEFIQDVEKGWSQNQLDRKYGSEGQSSRWIARLQEQGKLKNYVPQGGTGLTAAGKTPTTVQTKTQAKPAPEVDKDYIRELNAYLKKYGT